MISEKNSPNRSGRITPTVSVLRRVRLRAPLCGTKLSFLTAASTAAFVGPVTLLCPLIARDAVAIDTPASRATSLNVVMMLAPPLSDRAGPRVRRRFRGDGRARNAGYGNRLQRQMARSFAFLAAQRAARGVEQVQAVRRQ